MNKGWFLKLFTPWNKGKKGIHLSSETEFKEGQFVGKEHPSWKGGVQQNTKDCVYLWDGANKRVRRPRKVWEAINGPIPKGYIIVHLDENKNNDDISNLDCISRAELLKRNLKK